MAQYLLMYPSIHKVDSGLSIVAVHGLAADPIETWVVKEEKWNWLENQLVSIIPEARVWIFGYDSTWCGDKSVDIRLNEVVENFLDAIDSKVFSKVIRFPPSKIVFNIFRVF